MNDYDILALISNSNFYEFYNAMKTLPQDFGKMFIISLITLLMEQEKWKAIT